MAKKQFNVLYWDFNSDQLIHYDVLPYFRKCVKKSNVNDKIHLRDLIETESRYQFWSRCEYEMICHGWPKRKNECKLDIHDQIMMNIDVIVDILALEFIL